MSLFNLETVCINFEDTWEKCPDIDLKSVQETGSGVLFVMGPADYLLEVKDLRVSFDIQGGKVEAVKGGKLHCKSRAGCSPCGGVWLRQIGNIPKHSQNLATKRKH